MTRTNLSNRTRQLCTTLAVAMGLGACMATSQELAHDGELNFGADANCATDVSPPAPRTTRSDASMLVRPPERGAYFGAYQIPTQPATVDGFVETMGHVPPIVTSFHDFFSEENATTRPDKTITDRMEGEGSLRPLDMARYLADRGSVLALAWAVYCCDIERTAFWFRAYPPHDHINRILRGEHDDFIRASARQVRDYGGPIMITPMGEMNWQGQFLFGADGRQWMDAVDDLCGQYGDPQWPDGPERIRDLHMRIIDLFREEGAENVTWYMYAGNQYMTPGVEGQSQWLHPKYYYPGDAYIDWVGQSVFFTDPAWGRELEDAGPFEKVFLPGYNAWRSVTSRPLLLAEFGALSEPGDDRRNVLTDVLARKIPSLPGVGAVTIADTDLFEIYFSLPRVGNHAADTQTVRSILGEGYYATKLRLGGG